MGKKREVRGGSHPADDRPFRRIRGLCSQPIPLERDTGRDFGDFGMELRDIVVQRLVAHDDMIAHFDQLACFLRELKKDRIINIKNEPRRELSEPAIEPEARVVKATSLEVDRLGAKPSRLRVLQQSIRPFELIAQSPSDRRNVIVDAWGTGPDSTAVASLRERIFVGVKAKAGRGDIGS